MSDGREQIRGSLFVSVKGQPVGLLSVQPAGLKATEAEIEQALQDMQTYGPPRTPWRWMRKFGWSYPKADGIMTVTGCR